MDKIYTPDSLNRYKTTKRKDDYQMLAPSKQTVNLILQFANVYHVEKKIPAKLSEMILN